MANDDLAGQPHDNLFRAVFGEPAEAVGLLRAHLPPAIANGLQWSTLAAENSSFIAPDLRATESDLLYSVRRRTGGAPAWLYVLLEHQSTVRSRDRWMRLRLLQYCCRIWGRDRRRYPGETELRPIVPMVFYLGSGRWRYATEFSELFPREVRGWRWLPSFEHVLIDHSETDPEGVRGKLKGRLAQLMMLAVYRAAVAWPALERALPLLAELARRGGREQSMFVWYVLATQREPLRGRFAKELQRKIPGPEGDIMNYVEEIKQQGRREGRQEGELKGRQEGRQEGRLEGRQEGELKGRQEGRLETIEGLLRAGIGWPVILSATGIDEQTYRALKRDSANGTERAAPR